MSGEIEIKRAYESILMNDFERAAEWFEQAVAAEPDNASFHYKLSITYARSNRLAKAVEHAGLAVRLEPDEKHYQYHLNILKAKELIHQAETYFEESGDRLWMAAALLKQACELDALSTDAPMLLGLAYVRLKEYSQAIQAVNELLKLDPQNEAGQELLEECRHKLKQSIST